MDTRMTRLAAIAVPLLASVSRGAESAQHGPTLDTAQIEQLTGARGQLDEKEGVFKVSVPRTDLQPTVAGVKIPTSMGLTSWAAFDQGVYKVEIGRTTRMDGVPVGNKMGVNTWAAFAGSNERAVVDGDFAMLENELRPVLEALRGAGIDIVAIHQHMTGEQPRVMFLHYWGVGPAQDLARGLRAALNRTATRLGAR